MSVERLVSTSQAAVSLGYATPAGFEAAARRWNETPVFQGDGLTSGKVWAWGTVERIAAGTGRPINEDGAG